MSHQSKRPSFVRSYSSDYQHSVEHLVATRRLVEEADQETDSSVVKATGTGVRRFPQRQELAARIASGQ